MVGRFVRATLLADAGASGVSTLVSGRVHRRRVPQGTALPAITVQVVSQPDHNTLTGRHVYQDVQVDVVVRGEGEDLAPLVPIAFRVFAVLQELGGTQDGVQVVKLRRIDSQELTTTANGRSYSHLVQTFLTEAVPV